MDLIFILSFLVILTLVFLGIFIYKKKKKKGLDKTDKPPEDIYPLY